jgi:hypothetical protein
MVKKSLVALATAMVVMAFAVSVSANVTQLKAGETTVCENASWIVYNTSEDKETTLEFNPGPIGYSYGKVISRAIAPGGYQAEAITMKTSFKNVGPGDVSVNCQRQRYDRHDWKIDAGAGKTYQSDYHMDHVRPNTYIEPGLGQPEGTERGLGAVGGQASEANR